MGIAEKRLKKIRQRVKRVRERERHARRLKRAFHFLSRWANLLYYEFVKDDVQIRAQSLSYLMIFSLLPLIAGAFFLFSIFSQFGMVQDALTDGVQRFLETIPLEHRSFVETYVLQFKDEYLASLTQKSGSVGIFALLILGWVGLSTFTNIEQTLNYIWESEKGRPFVERIRSFIVVVVVAPIALIAGLSIPLIFKKTFVGQSLPALAVLVQSFIIPSLMVGTLYFLYRYVPVKKVLRRSAITGAVFSFILLSLANKGMELHFKYGTSSAYGKAAVVPLIGFWIYVVWIIVIMGAELSFLVQNQGDILDAREPEPSLREGDALLKTIAELERAYKEGKGPVSHSHLQRVTRLTSDELLRVIAFTEKEGISAPSHSEGELPSLLLAKDISKVKVGDLVGRFLGKENLSQWATSLDKLKISQLADKDNP